jgi:hypothetical protein
VLLESRFMKPITVALALAATLVAGPAAATSTFYLNDDYDPGACTQASASSGTYGNTYVCSQQTTSADELDVKAYSAATGANFAAANVADWSGGFGVRNTVEGLSASDPQHSMDNDGSQDLLLFKFDSSIALQKFQLGWYSTDSDVSILAYTGTGSAIGALTGSREDNLLNSGWTLVSHHSDTLTNEISFNGGTSAISSSYWIVSAFSKFGQSTPTWTDANDYVKLKMVSGSFTCVGSSDPSCASPPAGVPEPMSLALVGVALVGAWRGRRHAQAPR